LPCAENPRHVSTKIDKHLLANINRSQIHTKKRRVLTASKITIL
jgi:hypothetical protein